MARYKINDLMKKKVFMPKWREDLLNNGGEAGI
jgi:hypothetical protein